MTLVSAKIYGPKLDRDLTSRLLLFHWSVIFSIFRSSGLSQRSTDRKIRPGAFERSPRT